MENYITFKLRKPTCPIQMVFLDSFQFLPTSLEKLVKNLQPNQFTILKENFLKNSNFDPLTRKGVYPYDYLTSYERELPPPAAFYNSLTDEVIQDEDYQRGGISMISHKYAKANRPNTPDFEKNDAPSYILYWDANNLYGWAMSQFLPFGGFEQHVL